MWDRKKSSIYRKMLKTKFKADKNISKQILGKGK
jgi:hypothetical protein